MEESLQGLWPFLTSEGAKELAQPSGRLDFYSTEAQVGFGIAATDRHAAVSGSDHQQPLTSEADKDTCEPMLNSRPGTATDFCSRDLFTDQHGPKRDRYPTQQKEHQLACDAIVRA